MGIRRSAVSGHCCLFTTPVSPGLGRYSKYSTDGFLYIQVVACKEALPQGTINGVLHPLVVNIWHI